MKPFLKVKRDLGDIINTSTYTSCEAAKDVVKVVDKMFYELGGDIIEPTNLPDGYYHIDGNGNIIGKCPETDIDEVKRLHGWD